MELARILAWPLVVGVLFFTVILLGHRLIRKKLDAELKALYAKTGAEEVGVLEREIAARLSEQTLDARVALRNAQLEKERQQTIAAAALITALAEDRCAAALRVLEAETAARIEQAPKRVLAEGSQEDPVEAWARYLAVCKNAQKLALDFPDFLDKLNGL